MRARIEFEHASWCGPGSASAEGTVRAVLNGVVNFPVERDDVERDRQRLGPERFAEVQADLRRRIARGSSLVSVNYSDT